MSWIEDNYTDWCIEEGLISLRIDEYVSKHKTSEILETIGNKIKNEPESFDKEDLKIINSILNYYDKNDFVTDKQLKYIVSLAEIVN